MQFRDRLPAEVFTNPLVDKYLSVLDGAREYKESQVFKAARFYRPILETNLSTLRKLVEDFGYPPVPTDFPKEILDCMLLNAQTVMALKGSKLGLKFFLWVLTVGDITVDDSSFYPATDFIRLSDTYYGYVSNIDPLASPDLFLFSGSDNFTIQELTIDIATKYDSLTSMQTYIQDHIKKFISFASDSAVITINFTNGPYVVLPEAEQYFVIP